MFRNFLKMKQYFYITIYLITKINYCEFNNNVDQSFFTNNTAMKFFRFRDFEPRYTLQTDLHRTSENKRRSRGFQFHSDDRDFNVDLEFIVPFIRIPIARSMTLTQTAFRSLLNLNIQSIFTTGAIVAIGGIFAIILKIIFTQYVLLSNYRKSFRHDDFRNQNAHMLNQTYNENDMENILNINKLSAVMESKLHENNININHCIQRILCNYAQENFYTAKKTCREGLPRVLNGILSLDFVNDYLSGTSIKSALDTAKNGDSCFKVFNNCNLSLPSNVMLKMLADYFMYLNIT